MASLFTVLSMAHRGLVDAPCPSCGGWDGVPLVRHDRYFLPIDVSQCCRCGMVFAARTFSADAGRRFYAEHYARLMGMDRAANIAQGEVEGRANAAWRGVRVVDRLAPSGGILDVGCGDGYFVAECVRRGLPLVAGVEPGHDRRRVAAGAGIGAAPVFDCAVEDMGQLPFRPEVITMFHVLEHLNDPGAVLAHLSTLTDGWVVIEVPDIMGDWPSLGVLFFLVGHRTYFSPTTLSNLMIRSGLTPLIVETEGPEGGIHPANLRIFARPTRVLDGGASVVDWARPTGLADDATAQVRRFLRPWSWRNGYPRAALRLIRNALAL